MAKNRPLDEAFDRSRILTAILLQARDRAKASPLDQKWVECGIVSAGDTKADALIAINKKFDQLEQFLTYVSILDLSATFEHASRAKISNMIGELRKRAKGGGKVQQMPGASSGLIRSVDNFEGLAPIYSLVEGYAGFELKEQFDAIRDARNKISHGNSGGAPPKIEVDDAKVALAEILDLLTEL